MSPPIDDSVLSKSWNLTERKTAGTFSISLYMLTEMLFITSTTQYMSTARAVL